jgi:outer membrane protein TolC
VSASQATLRASQNTLLATRSDQRLAAKQAFLAVLRAQATVGVQNQALIDAQERLSQAQKELAAGTVAPVDEKRFEAQVAQAKSDLITAQNALDLAKQTFNQTLARPIETPVDLVEPAALPIVPSNVPGLVETGQKQRPEVRSLQATIESLADIRRATEAGMNPSLTFSLNNQRNLDATGFTASAETTTGVLALSIPIFDSGVTRDRVKAARQDELQAKIQLEQLELGISEEVRAAVTNLSSASSRLDNARQQVALAEEVYRLSKIRQDAGEGTYVEVIDAETQLTQARNSLVSARYDYLTAYSQLQRAIGSDDVGAAQAAGGK